MIFDCWTLRDGTRVHIGGAVDGVSATADYLRHIFAVSKREYVCSEYGFVNQLRRLDITVPYLLDSYLRKNFDVKSGPRVKYPTVSVPAKSRRGVVY